ncbi:hypothetical protein BJY04DRAFT_212166 [Aspergillus karnatakaensis]|uniref:uncharacterized protein n=1 Tax=Aspergillus karnatakaensis TaxID=1810916 RepID=UPI003CCE47BF
MTKASFNEANAYAPQEEGTSFFDDGREIELLHYVYSHPKLEEIRGSPTKVLATIDEYARTTKYLMNVGADKGLIVSKLIAEVKPKVMVELGGYIGYSCLLFADAVRKAGGSRYYSLEMNPEFAAVIMSLADLAGLSDIVKVVVGPSDASIARLHSQGFLTHIDLLFLDHYKPAYTTDLKLCEELRLITPGSVLAADNVIKPGNPPYLEYVRRTAAEKKEKLGEQQSSQGLPGKTVNQYEKRYKEMVFNNSLGNPNLVYESKLVNSFEPTGVPVSRYCYFLKKPSQKYPSTFYFNHVPKSILLILLSLAFLPIPALITLVSLLASYISNHARRTSTTETPNTPQKTILVTGVSMTKGLTITRLLSKYTSHRIIAADTEAVRFTSPGRYSRSIDKFYRLDLPKNNNAEPYISSFLDVITQESVDLWISCSSVIGAVEDGEVLRRARQQRGDGFKAVQFDRDVVERFHNKDTFIEYIQSLALLVPKSHRCTSSTEVEKILQKRKDEKKKFILKPIGVDDRARSQMMTLLPLQTGLKATAEYIATLGISASNPFILQQYVSGKEYCTHSLVVCGSVKAFVSCPSSDMLMHYEALPPDSVLNRKMLEFTERVAADGGGKFTGHLSFDFLVEGDGQDSDACPYPIECNPRAHTAAVFFQDTPEMARAYLSCFSGEEGAGVESIVTPAPPVESYYWAGHDLVTLFFLPLFAFFTGNAGAREVTQAVREFFRHLMYWRDGTFEAWDPVPFFVLYHVYWPCRFLESLIRGKHWSKINVSTTKMFAS